jgi:hypothetical protein
VSINLLRWSAFWLSLVLAVGALPCGLILTVDPTGGGMGMPLSMLEHSPFDDFRIPGLVLFTVNGLGGLLTAWAAWRDERWAPQAAVVMGVLLMGWMVVQILMIDWGSWLQTLYLLWGLLLAQIGYWWIKVKRTGEQQ